MSKVSIPQQVIAKFLRDKRGNPIGLACATKGSSGQVTVGWSFTAKVDRVPGRISKARAWEIALNRADRGTNAVCPLVMAPIVNEVLDRAKRYFHVDKVGLAGAI